MQAKQASKQYINHGMSERRNRIVMKKSATQHESIDSHTGQRRSPKICETKRGERKSEERDPFPCSLFLFLF